MPRIIEFFLALIGLLLLSPFLILIAIAVRLDSGKPVFFIQERVGKKGKPFNLYKFRTMIRLAHRGGYLTVGSNDTRVTRVGKRLRKTKLDELPQLFNVLKGDMSFVGPRPEVIKYVELYTEEQRRVLNVRPGITDLASIEFFNENELLGQSSRPEQTYIEEIMPKKLEINLRYLEKKSFFNDVIVIWKTVIRIFS